ncbi:hypothetical protein PIB30_099820 [Stylosanthes scabra]|uniref:Ty3-gypsy retrotransposon protein n=1 Tax=Stylosanthes scabra TaxID=79078 RepID=A0ABU6QXK0_9FABA|nr:hypothetical protein [Stylosanthes scabra]
MNVQNTKGDDKAIPYPKEEDAEGCMRIDVIEELIMEVQKEEAMRKFQAKQARKLRKQATYSTMRKPKLQNLQPIGSISII